MVYLNKLPEHLVIPALDIHQAVNFQALFFA
jgi:hypothetical protein